jgi:hypothetical protein
MPKKSKNDAADELFDAFLQDRSMKELENYLQRGRPLKGTTDEELKRIWVTQVKTFSAAVLRGFSFTRRELDDAQAELGLRKLDLPSDEVAYEWAAIQQAIMRIISDPTNRRELEEEYEQEMTDFENATKTNSTN